MPYRSVITTLKQNILDKEYYKNLVSKYQMAEILLIDDLFKGKVNETDINIMFEMSKDFIVEIKGQENNYRLRG